MKRENRYYVAKRKDIDMALNAAEYKIFQVIVNKIQDYREYIEENPNKKYVVVSEDWPMYEDTWKAIEEWVDAPTEKFDHADDALSLGKNNE